MYKVQREFDMLGLVVNYVCVWGGGGEEGGWGVGEVSYTCGRFFTYAAHHLYGTTFLLFLVISKHLAFSNTMPT